MTDEKTPFALADEEWEKGNYSEAFRLFMTLAERGDADAMSRVATMYGSGEGVETSFASCIEWGEKAVRAGSISSMINLGISYRDAGQIESGRQWFKKAWLAGDCEAALELAKLDAGADPVQMQLYLSAVIEDSYVSENSKAEAIELSRKYGLHLPSGAKSTSNRDGKIA